MYEMALILIGVAITLIYVAVYVRWGEKRVSSTHRWLNSTKIPIPQGKVVASCRFVTTPKGQHYWMPWEEWAAIMSEDPEG